MRVCPHRIGEEIEFNDSTDPNSLWASTQWTQVTDGRVTLASSSSHALGSTGGAETHTLSASEMPSHSHTTRLNASDRPSWSGRYAASGGSDCLTSSTYAWVSAGTMVYNCACGINVGGSSAHNNMQPWRAVNRWRRVA